MYFIDYSYRLRIIFKWFYISKRCIIAPYTICTICECGGVRCGGGGRVGVGGGVGEWLTLTLKFKFNFKVKIYLILSFSAR